MIKKHLAGVAVALLINLCTLAALCIAIYYWPLRSDAEIIHDFRANRARFEQVVETIKGMPQSERRREINLFRREEQDQFYKEQLSNLGFRSIRTVIETDRGIEFRSAELDFRDLEFGSFGIEKFFLLSKSVPVDRLVSSLDDLGYESSNQNVCRHIDDDWYLCFDSFEVKPE